MQIGQISLNLQFPLDLAKVTSIRILELQRLTGLGDLSLPTPNSLYSLYSHAGCDNKDDITRTPLNWLDKGKCPLGAAKLQVNDPG